MTKRELKAKLILKQEELRNAQSQTGPWILVILGILGLVFIVGIPLLIVGGVWSYTRTKDAERLAIEVADLEDQIDNLKE